LRQESKPPSCGEELVLQPREGDAILGSHGIFSFVSAIPSEWHFSIDGDFGDGISELVDWFW
jgi:hypothetical protein